MDEDVLNVPVVRRIHSLTSDEHISSTPIIDALLGIGDVSLATALDTNHASINAYDSSGRTAMAWAVIRNDVQALRLLLSYKADVSTQTRDTFGGSCLHLAVSMGRVAVVEELLAAGSQLDVRNQYGRTPLLSALMYNKAAVVWKLLEAGVKVNAVDSNGWNAFYYAAVTEWAPDDDIFGILETLKERGCDPDLKENRGYTATHLAVARNNVEVLRALWRVGARIDQAGRHGWTILHFAGYSGMIGTLSALAALEIDMMDPDLPKMNGNTAAALFAKRRDMSRDLDDGQTRPTREEVAAFENLISGLRERYRAKVKSMTSDGSRCGWEGKSSAIDGDKILDHAEVAHTEDEETDDEDWESCDEY
jgi:ankyrin repeat protein